MRLIKSAACLGLATISAHQVNRMVTNHDYEWNPEHVEKLFYYQWKGGNVAYQVRGHGEPLLLVHSTSTGSSSHEWRKNIDALAEQFEVYVLDLIGFGLSDKPGIDYSPMTYLELLHDFIVQVIQRPTHIVASSTSGAYCIRLATTHPTLIQSMILVCPTGLEHQKPKEQALIHFAKNILLSLPVFQDTFYFTISSKVHIRTFLYQYLYAHPESITQDLIDNYYLAAHQGGVNAANAPLAFLKGKLDLTIEEEWLGITNQTLVVWGQQACIHPVQDLYEFQRRNPTCSTRIFTESGLLPHDEEAYQFNRVVHAFLKRNTS